MKHLTLIILMALMALNPGAFGYNPLAGSRPGPENIFPGEQEKKQGKKDDPSKMANPSLLIDAKKEALTGNLKSASEKFRNIIEKFPDDPVAYHELARIEALRKNTADAISLARTAALLDPDNRWYTLFLAELTSSVGQFEESLTLYEKLAKSDPGNADYLYQLSALCMQLGKYREAVEYYDKIEEITGVSEEIVLQKEKIYRHLNDLKSAEKEIRKLIETYPRESRYWSILAEFFMANGMNEKALEAYHKVLEIDPENTYIHMSLADFYRKTGDNEKAYEELKLGFATPSLDIDAKVSILLSFYTVNQIVNELKEQAFTLAKILVETHPKEPKAYSIYGDLLLQDKKYTEARETFLKVLTLDSSRYVIWEQILQLDLQLSEYQHLVEYGNRTVELFPEQPLPFLFTGIGYLQLKKYEEAIRILRTGEKLVVDNSELQSQFCMYQGDALHSLKRDDEAFQAYEKSLALKGDNAYVLNNYAYYLSLKNMNLEKAAKMSKKAVEIDPENSSFQDTYGWVLFMQGNYTEAATWIEKAVNSTEDPASGEVLEHYGDVLFKLNDTDRAIEFWQKAFEKGGGSGLLQKKITDKKYYP